MEHGDPDLMSKGEEEQMKLPPGFRFHPTDEELITHYLFKKVTDVSFDDVAIQEVNLNKCEPWELPWRAKMGDKEWYCFCVRDRKYPSGLRTNRATEAGYWKATGKDKEIFRGKKLVGMKKTLVFYRGRAPKGEKSNWVMHEYRLEGKFPAYNLSRAPKEWVICRVLKKSWGGKKTTGMFRPLMDVAYSSEDKPASDTSEHVTCFSNVAEDHLEREEEAQNATDYFNNTNPMFQYYSSATSLIPNYDVSAQSSFFLSKTSLPMTNVQTYGDFQGSGGESFVQLLQNDVYGLQQQSCCKTEKEMLSNVSQETGLTIDLNPEISSVPSAASMHFADCLWSY